MPDNYFIVAFSSYLVRRILILSGIFLAAYYLLGTYILLDAWIRLPYVSWTIFLVIYHKVKYGSCFSSSSHRSKLNLLEISYISLTVKDSFQCTVNYMLI